MSLGGGFDMALLVTLEVDGSIVLRADNAWTNLALANLGHDPGPLIAVVETELSSLAGPYRKAPGVGVSPHPR